MTIWETRCGSARRPQPSTRHSAWQAYHRGCDNDEGRTVCAEQGRHVSEAAFGMGQGVAVVVILVGRKRGGQKTRACLARRMGSRWTRATKTRQRHPGGCLVVVQRCDGDCSGGRGAFGANRRFQSGNGEAETNADGAPGSRHAAVPLL